MLLFRALSASSASGTGSTLAVADGGPRAPWLVRYNLILPAEDKQETHKMHASQWLVVGSLDIGNFQNV